MTDTPPRTRAARTNRRSRLSSTCLSSMIALVFAGTAWAQADSVRAYDVPAGELAQSVNRIGQQGGVQVIYDIELLRGKRIGAVAGRLTLVQALERALSGSGLRYEFVNGETVLIKADGAPRPAPAGDPATSAAPAPRAQEAVADLQVMTVTGTRIRGGATPSPVITIGGERIREEGFTDLGQVVRSLPQNFNGGQNPEVNAGAEAGGTFNVNTTGGSSVNLRGIGQDATLTLLNGRRMSYGGFAQSVDISALPVEAVERIEVVTDGASAIYGSDAVGGVVNVVLKRDFDGVAVGARYGAATEGGLSTREYNLTAGSTWSSGGMIATFKKAANAPIYTDQRDFTRGMHAPSTLYQDADLRSGLLSLHQSLGDSVELHLDALRTERDMWTMVGYPTFHFRFPTETTTSLVSPGIVLALPGDWSLNASAALGKDRTMRVTNQVVYATGATTLTSFSYGNRSRMYEVGAEGPLLTLPGGDARLAVGAGYRHNDFQYFFNDASTADGDEGSRFAYAELNVPLVGADQGVKGVHRLGLTGAVRTEDYDNYGRVTTPKIGLIYSPSADWTMKASWGKSFKAPTLYQGYSRQSSYLYRAATFGGAAYGPDATVLYLAGGNRELSPERATTWSGSIAFHPAALPGLEAELTAFDIDYTGRIIRPITIVAGVLSTSIYEDFIRYAPTAAEQAGVLASTQFANYVGAPYDPAKVVAIIDDRFVNASVQRVKGVDLSGAYRFDLPASRLTLRGSLSRLDIEQALTATSDFFDGSGILFYPARLGSRAGAVWNKGGFTASFFGNHKSGVTNLTDGRKGASYTTFDTTLRYDTIDGVFADMSFEFSAQNLFNRAPPLYAATSLTNPPYDSTNYSAIGRFLSLSVSKQW